MALTPEQIEARRTRVGASDVACIFGLPTFKGRNAYSLWLDKTGQLEPEGKAEPWIEDGNRLESIVLDRAEKELGPLKRQEVVADPQGSPIVSMLDGQVIADGHPVEAKTSGIQGPIHGTWGEAGTDDVPQGYIVQCQTQLLCTEANICDLMALLGGRGFVNFRIQPIPEMHAQIRAVTTDFWERYVMAKRDPRTDWWDRLKSMHGVDLGSDPCEPVLETVKRLRKSPGKSIDVDNDAVVQSVLDWDAHRQARIDMEKVEKSAQAAVLAAMGDAEEMVLPGGIIVSNREQNGAPLIDRDRMKADGVWDTYATPNRYRVMRLKKPKA